MALTAASQSRDVDRMIDDIAQLESVFSAWEESPRSVAGAYGQAIEALNGEALRRLVASLKRDPAALGALREAVADEVVYAVLRRHNILKPSLTERVEAALGSVRPMLASHGGDVELVRVDPPAIEVRFTGSCNGCPASQLTFHAGVKKAVEGSCPEITEIRMAKGFAQPARESARFVSPFSLASEGRWHVAVLIDEIPDCGVKALRVADQDILLARRGAAVACVRNACAHLGLPMDRGAVADGVIACPHHGFRYDLFSGECLTAPVVQLEAHPVRLVGRHVEVRLRN